MSDYTDAQTNLEESISVNKDFLKVQDQPATLETTLAAIKVIDAAVKEWTRAEVSLKAITATTIEELQSALVKNALSEMNKEATKFNQLVVQLEMAIKDWAKRATPANP